MHAGRLFRPLLVGFFFSFLDRPIDWLTNWWDWKTEGPAWQVDGSSDQQIDGPMDGWTGISLRWWNNLKRSWIVGLTWICKWDYCISLLILAHIFNWDSCVVWFFSFLFFFLYFSFIFFRCTLISMRVSPSVYPTAHQSICTSICPSPFFHIAYFDSDPPVSVKRGKTVRQVSSRRADVILPVFSWVRRIGPIIASY